MFEIRTQRNVNSQYLVILLFTTLLLLINLIGFPFSTAITSRDNETLIFIVDINGNGDFTSIQDAIDNAPIGTSAVLILVYDGIYEENLYLNSTSDYPIEIRGNSTSTTIISGNYTGDVITLNRDNCVISNFFINGSRGWGYDAGIKINSDKNKIINCYCCENRNGITVDKSSFNTIENCNFSNNDEEGIFLIESPNNIIDNCICDSNMVGIQMFDHADNNHILNSSIKNNWMGGIWFSSFSSNNTIENCALISNRGSGLLVRFSSNNNTIINTDMKRNDGYGASIQSNSNNNTIKYCNLNNNEYSGILIDQTNNNTIMNSSLCNNNRNGINLFSTEKTNLINNNCSFNRQIGINVSRCSEIRISNGSCLFNKDHGISFTSSDKGEDSFLNFIFNVSCENNGQCGIYLYGTDVTTISGCGIKNNKQGLFLEATSDYGWSNHQGSNFNTISKNNFINNLDINLKIGNYNHYNLIYHNIFINSTNGIQAMDDYNEEFWSNDWNTNFEGNYWSDWIGPDENNNGIVDIPYEILGEAKSVDEFPLTNMHFMDNDGDGISDFRDEFPNNISEWSDSDKDTVGDNSDAFPTDPSASLDTDEDGHPDAWNSGMNEINSTLNLTIDHFPFDPDKWDVERDDEPSNVWIIVLTILLIIVSGCIIVGVVIYKRKEQDDTDKNDATRRMLKKDETTLGKREKSPSKLQSNKHKKH